MLTICMLSIRLFLLVLPILGCSARVHNDTNVGYARVRGNGRRVKHTRDVRLTPDHRTIRRNGMCDCFRSRARARNCTAVVCAS